MELLDDYQCFVCGKDNALGLKLSFEIDEKARSISTSFVPQKAHQGYKDVVHGGIISTVLDEAMTKLAYSLGENAVTARLTVRFKKPLMVGEKVKITGRLTKESGRAIEAEAKAVKDDGTVIAEAEGLLMRVKA
ncbi:MAG: PaaI family thioesterase [Nitrospirota bacterium]